ncbi:tautomerase family protein [Gordonia westfalica]|uniref:Tautomerase family protein n=1 Tax=Gordonia westfalica TaxID=158898 RepID=A0ABU2GZR9_9ACTN|nr:tautomerase family protein [Gordonia westfalica]MDS1116957.1 tautomerase family protein [Gordonia westfalica]
MPYIEASFFEDRFTDRQFAADMVAELTKAVSEVLGDEIGSDTTVVLHGVARAQWGHGGKLMG